MNRRVTTLFLVGTVLLAVAGLLFLYYYWQARAQQQYYLVLDTTREQFLGEEPGAAGSTSVLTFTAASRAGNGAVHLLPLGVVGDWETQPSPLLPYPIESAAAVIHREPTPPYRQRIYLIGGYKPTIPALRLDTVYTCEVLSDGSLSDWTLQANHLPQGLSSAAAAISTEDVHGNPITPTIYLLGGKFSGGTSDQIYYAHIDPNTLDVGPWQTGSSSLGGRRLGLSAVANDGYLYAIGGLDDMLATPDHSAAVWHFSIQDNGEPTSRAVDLNLPGADPTNNPNAVYHQTFLVQSASPSFPTDTLYVVGGHNKDNSTPRVLRGDIWSSGSEEGYVREWVEIGDDLPQALSAFAVAQGNIQGAGRQVYIIGGDQGVNGGNPQNTIRSAAVDDADNSFYRWYGLAWLTSPALPAPRYRHAAVQMDEYIYAIGGHGEEAFDYYDDVLRGHLVGVGAKQFAPSGAFLSRVVDLGRKYRLTWMEWNTTITPTDPGVSLTLQFRAGNRPDLSDASDGWTDLYASARGYQTRTLVPIPNLSNFPFYPPIARYVQYRALLSTTAVYSNISPLLHEVGVHVEDSPDLIVSNIQISCEDCYSSLGIISRTIVVSVTVQNQGGNIPVGNNFWTTLFITSTSTYEPQPPDWPTDPTRFLPGSAFWGLQGGDLPSGAKAVLTTTMFFTQPRTLYLYAYADYNDTGLPPDYDVGEADPGNNLTIFPMTVLDPQSASKTQTAWYWETQTAKPTATTTTPSATGFTVHLPLVLRNYARTIIYLPLVNAPPAKPMRLPAPQHPTVIPTPEPRTRTPVAKGSTPSPGP